MTRRAAKPANPAKAAKAAAAAAATVAGVLALAAGCAADTAERDTDGRIVEAGTVRVDGVRVGDCFGPLEPGEVDELDAVPCGEPHHGEVYQVAEIPGGEDAPFPGREEVEATTAEACLEAFEAFVGVPYESSSLEIQPIFPSEQTWEQSGDRQVVCAAYDPRGEVTGTLEGSRR